MATSLGVLVYKVVARHEGVGRGDGQCVNEVGLRARLAERLGERRVGVVVRGLVTHGRSQLPLHTRTKRVSQFPLGRPRMALLRGEGVGHLPLAVRRPLRVVEGPQLTLTVGGSKLLTHLLKLQGWWWGLLSGLHKLLV